MRSLDPASKISSLGLGLDRVLSSNFIVIKIRMVIPRQCIQIPVQTDLFSPSKSVQDHVQFEHRILFSLN